MSLTKQLVLGLSLILFLVFATLFWSNLHTTRNFIEEQLQSHAQDTATSLGLSVSPYLDDESNLPIVETMIQAIFDRGFYSEITLYDTDQNVLLTFENPSISSDVPEWFVKSIELNAPLTETQLNNQWKLYGSLAVKSNLSIGYDKLYAESINLITIFLGLLIPSLFFAVLIVKHVVSKPLSSMLEQVDAVSEQRFTTIEDTPKTPEFAKIIGALNLMSHKLSKMFSQLTKQIEDYRRYAYVDTMTNTGNRRSYELKLNKLLGDSENQIQGILFVIRATSLATLNRALGANKGNEYLLNLARLIDTISTEHFKHSSIFRISGSDFAVLMEDVDEEQAQILAREIVTSSMHLEKNEHEQGIAHIGITQFFSGDTFSDVMKRVDTALTSALETKDRWSMLPNDAVSYSNEEWRSKIIALLEAGEAEFAIQPIMAQKENEVIYQEWFARLPDKTRSMNVPMNQLIPASIKLDYAVDIDKLIITNFIKKAEANKYSVGLNISRMSLLNEEFCAWLLTLLSQNESICQKLVLEIPERAIIHDEKYIRKLCNKLKNLGCRVTIEHFGAQLAGLKHIRSMKPDYIKLDGQFVRNIDQQPDNQLFVKSLINIADGLSIKLIAEMVETKAEVDWLANAGIDIMQGYYIATPD